MLHTAPEETSSPLGRILAPKLDVGLQTYLFQAGWGREAGGHPDCHCGHHRQICVLRNSS